MNPPALLDVPWRAGSLGWFVLVAVLLCAWEGRALATPIGYTRLYTVELESHRMLEVAAEEAHKIGDYQKSAELFAQLTELAPDDLNTRYNLACARALQGNLSAAFEQLQDIFTADLVGFERLYRTDPDFASLRSSPYGARLEEHIESLRPRYRSALEQGIPAVRWLLYRPTDPRATEALGVQAGVYLHASRRFVPLTPMHQTPYGRRPMGSTLLLPRERVAVSVVGTNERVQLFASPAPTDLEGQEVSIEPAASLDVAALAGGALWRGREADVAASRGAPFSFLPSKRGGEREHAPPVRDGPMLRVTSQGVLLTYRTSGFAVSGRTLRTPNGSVLLSQAHALGMEQWFVPAPTGAGGLVISNGTCPPESPDCSNVRTFAIDIIDALGKARPWLHGAGWAVVSYERSGAVYVQLSPPGSWGELRRYAKPGAARYEQIMPGVLLVAAMPGRALPPAEGAAAAKPSRPPQPRDLNVASPLPPTVRDVK